MKILLDQNISFRVVKKIQTLYTEARQVRELGLENASDKQIWSFAKEHHFTIVTFDADFYDLANLLGHPPKIIWLRTGNTGTEHIAALLLEKAALIKEFICQSDNEHLACLEIDV